MTKLTDEELAAIKAQADACAPGPYCVRDDEGAYLFITDGKSNFATDVDKEEGIFFAAARKNVPDLLSHIDALTADVSRLRALLVQAVGGAPEMPGWPAEPWKRAEMIIAQRSSWVRQERD